MSFVFDHQLLWIYCFSCLGIVLSSISRHKVLGISSICKINPFKSFFCLLYGLYWIFHESKIFHCKSMLTTAEANLTSVHKKSIAQPASLSLSWKVKVFDGCCYTNKIIETCLKTCHWAKTMSKWQHSWHAGFCNMVIFIFKVNISVYIV